MMLDKNGAPMHLKTNEEVSLMIKEAIEEEQTNRERMESIEKFKPGIVLEWDKLKESKIIGNKKSELFI